MLGSPPPKARVLMLARHFPPIGGAGVHRSVGYVRHLPDHGFQTVVVTGPGDSLDRWSPRDIGLLDRLPESTEIHRLEGPEPRASGRFAATARRRLMRPERWVRWWIEGAVRKGLELGEDVDVILASCVPYETAEAGARLSAELGKPWIADLEDPWALDEMRVHPTALHRRVDFARMRRALATASGIVMSAPEAARRVRRALPEHRANPVVGVPIGFDPADLAPQPGADPSGLADGDPASPGGRRAMRIVHTGSLHTGLGLAHRRSERLRRRLGGSSLDVDILPRSVVYLCEAIERAAPALPGPVELHLAGALTDDDEAALAGRAFVVRHGQLEHTETLALLRSADLLFLPMHDLPGRAGLIPYKTYEYLASRRPILAAVPDGDVREMLAPLARADVVRPTDVPAMAAAIVARASSDSALVPDAAETELLRELERPHCVARIVPILDALVARPWPLAPAARSSSLSRA